MNTTTITRTPSAATLDDEIKREADRGPIMTKDGYTILSPADWERILDMIDGEIAMGRRNSPEGATLDEMRRKYGL